MIFGKSKKNDKVESKTVNGLPSFVENKRKDNYDAKKDKLIITDHKEKKFNIKSFAIITCILLILGTAIFMLKFIDFDVTEMLWKVTLTKGSDEVNNKSIRYEGFRNGMVRISNDGITFINSHGEVKWTISYNMKEPIYESKRKYFAISDRNAFEYYIFDENGLVSKGTSKLPIQKISLTEDGTLYTLISDENDSFINSYSIKKDVSYNKTIKTNMDVDGIPIDISASENGERLLVDYIGLSDKEIHSKAMYYDFSDNDTSNVDVIGEYNDAIKDSFIGRVHFFDNEKSCIISDKSARFLNVDSHDVVEVISEFLYEGNIKSISYNDNYLAMIFEDGRFVVCNKTGDILTDKKIDFEYDNFYIDDDYIIFLSFNKAIIYDARGRILFDREMNIEVEYIVKKKSLFFTELLVGLVDGIECIRFY